MQIYVMQDFLARSTDKDYADTELAQTLRHLPTIVGGYGKGPWIGGGAVRRTILGQPLTSDFDFFFSSETQLKNFEKELVDRGFNKVRETEHHIHYRGVVQDKSIDVQLIRFLYYGSPREVIDSFDFTICQFVFDGLYLFCGEYSLWDLGRKRLAIHRLTYPVASMRRLLKYATQGFTACPGCLATILRETATDQRLLDAIGVTYVD